MEKSDRVYPEAWVSGVHCIISHVDGPVWLTTWNMLNVFFWRINCWPCRISAINSGLCHLICCWWQPCLYLYLTPPRVTRFHQFMVDWNKNWFINKNVGNQNKILHHFVVETYLPTDKVNFDLKNQTRQTISTYIWYKSCTYIHHTYMAKCKTFRDYIFSRKNVRSSFPGPLTEWAYIYMSIWHPFRGEANWAGSSKNVCWLD